MMRLKARFCELAQFRPLTRRRLLWGAVLGLITVLSSAPPASAQDLGRLEEELRRTDEKLAWARPIVAESTSQRAREILDQAFRAQGAAWDNFRAGRPLVSWRLTQEARRLGLRAVTLAREDMQLRNRARRELDRARETMRRTVEELGPSLPEPARRLLAEAREQLRRAEGLFAEQHYEAALRLAISAQRLVRQAEGLGANAGEGGRVLRDLERTDRLIERAAPLVHESHHEDATRMLDRAIELQGGAWEAFRAGRARGALARTREARGLVNRALGLVRGPVDGERVAEELAETDSVLERATDVVREAGSDSARRILETAREHQKRARGLFADREFRAALAQTLVARRLAQRAIRIAQGEGEW
jgi:tetratricopeptide (TPR) repeat protein